MSDLAQDIRYALRQLRKSPGFTVAAVLTLAFGIGGNTAIFSLINACMLRTLPVKDPQRLVLLKWKAKGIPKTEASSSYDNCPQGSGPALGGGAILSDVPLDSAGCSFSLPYFERLQREQRIFSNVVGFAPAEFTVNSGGRTSPVRALFISGDFFGELGAHSALGRLLGPRDDSEGSVPSIVVSNHFWQSQLGGDRTILGKQVLIGKTSFTVAGVTAQESAQLDPGLSCDLWMPLAFRGQVPPYSPRNTAAGAIWLELIGRLQPGISLEQAGSALSASFAAMTTNGPEAMFKASDAPQIELATAARGLATLRRNFSRPLFTLLIAVALVLLVSSVNIAGLMLARSASRRKEFGMRLALGATHGRVARQLLVESLLLAVAGGAIGVLVGEFGARVLVSFFSHNWYAPLQLDVHSDPRVLVFTLLVSILVGAASGLAPAFSTIRSDPASVFRGDNGGSTIGPRRRLAFGSLIVVVQIALAMPILAGTGLVVRTLENLRAVNLGFDPRHLLVFRVDSTYSLNDGKTLYRDLQQRLNSLPGVTSVSRSGVPPLGNEGMSAPIVSDGQPIEARAHGLPMSSNFLTTMGIRLHEGEILSDRDAETAPAKSVPTRVVVNETLVRQLFPGQHPVGKHLRLGSVAGPEFEITGVVSDAKYMNPRDTVWPTVYTPIAGWHGPVYFEVRTAMEPKAVMPEIRAELRRFDSNLLISGLKTEVEQIDQDIYQERLVSALSSLFAVLALTVTCIGIYGLLAFQTARRIPEIGVRIALGAQRRDVLRFILRQGAVLALAGALIGSAAALVVNRYLQSFLFGIQATDPLTMVAAGLLLIGVAVMASFIPARRAAKVDPMVALRYE